MVRDKMIPGHMDKENKNWSYYCTEGLNGRGGGEGPLVGCRLKFSDFVGSRLNVSIFVGRRKISVNK